MANSPSSNIQSALVAFILALIAFGGLFVAFGGLHTPHDTDSHVYEGTAASGVSEDMLERVVERVLARQSNKDVVVRAHDNASINLDVLSNQIFDRLQTHLHASITDYIDQVAVRVARSNGTAIKPTLAPRPPAIPELRWTGGARSQRCVDINEHWKGQAKAWNCQGKESNWQKLYLTKDNRLEYRGRCLDATNVKANAPIAVNECSKVPGQQWEYNPSPDQGILPTAPLKNKGSGLCLAVADGNYPETIIVKPCDTSCQLIWSISVDERSASQKQANLQSYNKRIQEQSPRIVCWIMTHAGNRHKAVAVNNTWGQRCTHLMFMSSTADPTLPVVLMDIAGKEDSRSMLRPKSKQGWLHMYENFLDKGDFFLKGDDDSYVVMENLKVG